MKRSRVRGLVLASAFLVVPGALPAGEPLATPSTASLSAEASSGAIMEVSYHDGLLSVKAEKADLGAFLKKISESTGIAVQIGPEVAGTVSLSFSALRLEDGINRILEAVDSKNYAAEFTRVDQGAMEYRLRSILVVLRPVGSIAPQIPAPEKFPRSEAGVRQFLNAKFGRVVNIECPDWDRTHDRLKWLGYYDEGISKRVNRNNIGHFAETIIGELAWFFDTDTAHLEHQR